MPRRAAPAPASPWLSKTIANTIIALLGTLIATGIVSMINLYAHMNTLTEDVHRTEVQLGRHLEHSVDRDEWLRRDSQIQRSIDAMATKEDLAQLREYISGLVTRRPAPASER